MASELDPFPDLVPHCKWCRWFRLMCPDCGEFFPNSMWTYSVIGYPMHYAMVHLGINPFRRLGNG